MSQKKASIPYKQSAKLTSWLSGLGISIVLIFSLLSGAAFFHSKPVQAASLPAYRYTKTFDTSSGSALGYADATDSQGNVYVTGRFGGTVTFDGTGGSDSQTDVGGSGDTFLTKYNANGSYGYTKTFDTSGGAQVIGFGVTTDSQGNVYVTGQFNGTVIFDGTGGSDSQTTSNNSAFLTKYNANGSYGYTKTFDTSAGDAEATGVATDSQGNVYFTGRFSGTVTFDGTGGSDSQTDAGGSGDSFLTKYNANGSYGYTKTFDTSAGDAEATGVATDSQGNVYFTGGFGNTIIFDGTGGSDSQTSSNSDVYLTKYNANGSYGYTKTFDTSAGDAGAAGVATDSQGNIYWTGRFSGTVAFDGTGGSDSQTASNSDVYLTKYNANGSYGYTKAFDTSAGGAQSQAAAVATDAQGNIYMTGQFNGTVIFDGTGGTDSQTASNTDTFLTQYKTDGSYGWTRSFDTTSGSTSDDSQAGVTADAQGNVYITGDFFNTVIFDGPGGSDSQTSSGDNMFLTSYQTFIPGSGPSSSLVSVPGAPNTGFGTPATSPFHGFKFYGLSALVIASLSVLSTPPVKRWPRKAK